MNDNKRILQQSIGYAGHCIGQGLGWFGFWIMIGLLFLGSCGVETPTVNEIVEVVKK